MNTNDYPAGADNKFAPWREKCNKELEVEVTVSLSLCKTFTIKTTNYVMDEDGKVEVIDLPGEVEARAILPNNLSDFVEKLFNYHPELEKVEMPKKLKKAIEDSKDWVVVDYDIIIE